jgi:hypothetical protein
MQTLGDRARYWSKVNVKVNALLSQWTVLGGPARVTLDLKIELQYTPGVCIIGRLVL